MQTLELLAPARDAATALAAIRHGADAVYIGPPAFGARAAAANSLEDIVRVVEAAHPFGVRVYVTLNTIIFENELPEARMLIDDLWRIGVDALIVQDMALLEMDIPPIDLHASTQTDARDIDKIRRLADAGFSQIVVPREFSLDEIAKAAQAVPEAKIEVFVHGALCVSYSGDCHAGALLTGRSANRGECPQICRLKFTLTDRAGRPVNLPDGTDATRHWLSLADMNRLCHLKSLVDAGARSFKIEGRLKAASYVKNVTSAYSAALDRIVEDSAGAFRRASFGTVEHAFVPDVRQSFNRGFTPYFLTSDDSRGITSWKTPKWVGRPVGVVHEIRGNRLKIKGKTPINNGDGLGYFDADANFAGFRVNKVEGGWIYPAPGAVIPSAPGVTLYRNADTAWEGKMNRDDTARRSIAVKLTLRPLPGGRVAIDAADERGCAVTVASSDTFTDKARTPQPALRRAILERLGDTIYRLDGLEDFLEDMFIPSKALASLRRRVIAALDSDWNIKRRRMTRRRSDLSTEAFAGMSTTYHDNVANTMAERFYRRHGAKIEGMAAEVDSPRGETRVMTTKYCLRRELGCCLKEKNGKLLPAELWLDAPVGRLRLAFDCKACNMHVIKA